MRRAAKVDSNQGAIVAALRAVGATVVPTHTIGRGFPDLVVGFRDKNFLLEVKDGGKPPSARKLTPDEAAFFDEWRGSVILVNDEMEALRAIGAVT